MDDKKKVVRLARRQLTESRCTCVGKHDPFWVECPRTVAEIAFKEALARAGFIT